MAADTCENANVRVQSSSMGLPDCRAYELVTPRYMQGFDVDVFGLGFTDDGLVSYRSGGSFAGNGQGTIFNPYHANRSAAGWVQTALAPPGVLYDAGGGLSPAVESDDLRWTLWTLRRRDVPGDTLGFYRRGLDGVFTRIGEAASAALGQRVAVGWSDDFSHLVFNHGPQNASGFLEYVGTGNGGSARAVSVNNLGQQTSSETCPNDVSADGRVIVYTAGCGGGGVLAVWARVAGSALVAVSGSECTRNPGDQGGACNAVAAASYEGGADDGSRVFFTTNQQLVNGDIDAGNDLYACDIPPDTPAPTGVANPCDSLTEVSGTATDAKVEDVVAVSEDGSQVYFVAQGVLADNLGVGGVGPATVDDQAVPHNLYVWQRDGAHPAGQTRFVARLEANDVAGGQLTPDGRYLLLLTASKLVTADSDGVIDAYRFDAVNQSMVRMSSSVSGGGGNDPGTAVSFVEGPSMMSADGSTVIFDTDEGLSAADTNGITDVYSWRDGQVSLISAGGGRSMGIGASGRDIFFTTFAQVVSGDSNANKDIYDARVGGGFPEPAGISCSGDACQGQHNQRPSLPGPAAVAGGGGDVTEAATGFSLRGVSAVQRRRLAATGKVSLVVTANAPGVVSVRALSTVGGRALVVGSARRSLSAPGRVVVSLTLSQRARRQLAGRGQLTVKLDVSHSKVALGRSVTLRLTKARGKRSAKRASMGRPVAGVRAGGLS